MRLEAFKYNYVQNHPSDLFSGFPTEVVLAFLSPLETGYRLSRQKKAFLES